MSSSFVQDDATLLISLIVFVFWQMSTRSSSAGQSGQNRMWYDRNRKEIPGGFIPGIVFPIVWTLLYSLIVASMYIFIKEFQATRFYIVAIVLFIVNIMLNKLWSVAFFDNEDTMTSLLIAIGMLLTEIAVLILFGLDDAWVSFGLWCPYVLWTLFAIYLNYQWYKKGLPTVTNGKFLQQQMQLQTNANQYHSTLPVMGTPNVMQHQYEKTRNRTSVPFQTPKKQWNIAPPTNTNNNNIQAPMVPQFATHKPPAHLMK